jgi:light-regulated signal transduction histidine kinase (bacteriophytochrome)
VVHGDATQMEQLLQNLIGNAIKFRKGPAPQVHIDARREDAAWRIDVCDDGIGIDPRYAERIFVIFQRLHTAAEYPGTGIGLAICKKIVERHGGHIDVRSTPARGHASVSHCPTGRSPPCVIAPSGYFSWRTTPETSA